MSPLEQHGLGSEGSSYNFIQGICLQINPSLSGSFILLLVGALSPPLSMILSSNFLVWIFSLAPEALSSLTLQSLVPLHLVLPFPLCTSPPETLKTWLPSPTFHWNHFLKKHWNPCNQHGAQHTTRAQYIYVGWFNQVTFSTASLSSTVLPGWVLRAICVPLILHFPALGPWSPEFSELSGQSWASHLASPDPSRSVATSLPQCSLDRNHYHPQARIPKFYLLLTNFFIFFNWGEIHRT